MIPEVDNALRALIEREATDGTEVEVMFEAPTKDWASRRNVPTIDVYLYDIREDLRRRERGLINEYDGSDRVATRRLPPRHFKLSYLVTAWTQRPEDEHRLLSALLSCFLRHDAIPPELITGPLADMALPVPVTVALPPPEDRSFADVWSALGGELKPSLDVVVSAPTDTGQQYAAGPPVTAPGRISMGGMGQWPPRENAQGRDRSGAAVDGDEGAIDGDDGDGSAQRRRGSGGSSGAGSVPGAGSDRGAGAPTTAQRAAVLAAAGGASMVRGMSWRELAGTGVADAGERATAGPSAVAADEPSDRPAKTAPGRRRRQPGISHQ